MKDYIYKIIYTRIELKLYIIIQYSFINILFKKKGKTFIWGNSVTYLAYLMNYFFGLYI